MTLELDFICYYQRFFSSSSIPWVLLFNNLKNRFIARNHEQIFFNSISGISRLFGSRHNLDSNNYIYCSNVGIVVSIFGLVSNTINLLIITFGSDSVSISNPNFLLVILTIVSSSIHTSFCHSIEISHSYYRTTENETLDAI